MKTAAKVFIILGMISGCLYIFPLVVGIIALKKLKSATEKSQLVSMGVVTLIFCSLIGGILMLCLSDEDLAPKAEEETPEYVIPEPVAKAEEDVSEEKATEEEATEEQSAE